MENKKKSSCIVRIGGTFLAIVAILAITQWMANNFGEFLDRYGSRSPGTATAAPIAPNNPAPAAPSTLPADNSVGENTESTKTASYEITDTSFNYYTNIIDDAIYYGIVEVTNTGTVDLYMASCTFDLEDKDGHLLQSEDLIDYCPDIIAPGEKGYFYNGIGALVIDSSVSLDNGVFLKPTVKLEKAQGKSVEYEVSDLDIRNGDFGPTVTGRVKNTTNEDDSLCYIYVLYYDKNDKVLAITGTSITDLEAGAKKSFEISGIALPEYLKYDDIAKYKVIARRYYIQF